MFETHFEILCTTLYPYVEWNFFSATGPCEIKYFVTQVMPKRTNKPGLSSTNRPPRGMRGRGRSFRGGGGGGGFYYSGYRPMRRGRYYPYWHISTLMFIVMGPVFISYKPAKTSWAFSDWPRSVRVTIFVHICCNGHVIRIKFWIQMTGAEWQALLLLTMWYVLLRYRRYCYWPIETLLSA